MFCLQENYTLPRGPDEVSEVWRAGSRAGFSLHTTKFWGCGLPSAGVFITVLSRVVEKSAAFTMMVLYYTCKYLVDHYGVKFVTDFCIRSDVATHYRCRLVIGGVAITLNDLLRSANGTDKYGMITTRKEFGLECHDKNVCDRYFSECKGRITEAEWGEWMIDPIDVVKVLERGYNAKSENGEPPVEHFIDFLPTEDSG